MGDPLETPSMSQHILSTPHVTMALPARDRRVVGQAIRGMLNRFLLLPLGAAIALAGRSRGDVPCSPLNEHADSRLQAEEIRRAQVEAHCWLRRCLASTASPPRSKRMALLDPVRRFGFDRSTCEAILAALVEAGVLVKLILRHYDQAMRRSFVAALASANLDARGSRRRTMPSILVRLLINAAALWVATGSFPASRTRVMDRC